MHGLNVASSLNLQNERPHLQIETLDEIPCGEQTQSADWYVSICRLSPLPQPKLQSKICHRICRLDLHNCSSQSADWAHMSKNIPATQLNLQIEPILHLHSISSLVRKGELFLVRLSNSSFTAWWKELFLDCGRHFCHVTMGRGGPVERLHLAWPHQSYASRRHWRRKQ